MPLDINELEHVLNNDNHTILNTTYKDIKKNKNDILQNLNLKREKLKLYNEKLKDYRYIDELSDIVMGNYCRWIDLNNEDVNLAKGGFLTSINIFDKGPYLCIKTFNSCINIKANEILLFQKINFQEKLLLKVMKYIEK